MTRLEVLECVVDPQRTKELNPYTVLLCEALESNGAEVTYFSWRKALFGRYNILHVHWPESLWRSTSPVKRTVKQLLSVALLIRLSLGNARVVRTVHNLRPHEEGTRVEAWFTQQLERRTSARIALNDTTSLYVPGEVHQIPHGHYRDWYRPSGASPERGRILTFGLIRPYKGTEKLITEFRGIKDTSLGLRVVGKPTTDDVGRSIQTLASHDSRVHATLRFATDDELAHEISLAEAIVLPYASIHNSGAALLALSLHRPIIVTDSPSTRLLAEEFGTNWVHLLPTNWAAPDLSEGLQQLRKQARDPRGPDMSQRDWTKIGRQHVELMMQVLDWA